MQFYELKRVMPPLPTPRDKSFLKYIPIDRNFRTQYYHNIRIRRDYFSHREEMSHYVRNPPIGEHRVRRRNRIRIERYELPFDHNIPIVIEPNKNAFTKPAAVAIGPRILTDPVICNYRSTNNHIRGLMKRVIHDVNFDRSLAFGLTQFTKRFLKQHYKPLPYVPISIDTLDEFWLNNAEQYTLKQKQRFRDLLNEFNDNNNNAQLYTQYRRGRLYRCKSFIKREFYAELKEPRIINARPDLFKSIVAPYIKMIEHEVLYNKHFIKGKRPHEIAERMSQIRQQFSYIAETDYSSFEGSFSDRFQNCVERQLFQYMLINNPIIAEIVEHVYTTRNKMTLATSKGLKFKAACPGSRMSGDMWTSLANGFTNMILFLYVVKKSLSRRHYKPDNAATRYDFIVEGDDGFFGTNFKLNFSIIQRLGFQLKVHYANDINDLSFCGICVGPNQLPVPDFWRQLEKFGWEYDENIINRYSDKITKHECELMRAKALSLLACAPGNPILQPLCVKILKLTEHVTVRPKTFDFWDREVLRLHTYTPTPVKITFEMRKFYEQRFQVSINEQIEIENIINSSDTIRFMIPLSRPKQL